MTEATEQFWRGNFGAEYTERNKVDWRERVDFFRDVLEWVNPSSVLEVGCGSGHNLVAIKSIDPACYVHGLDINEAARKEAALQGLLTSDVPAVQVGKYFTGYNLVMSVGLLIHIAPEEINEVLKGMISASTKYVLAVEYSARCNVNANYRGHDDRLWKRPYGEMFEHLGLHVSSWGDAGPAFDRCTYWLMEK